MTASRRFEPSDDSLHAMYSHLQSRKRGTMSANVGHTRRFRISWITLIVAAALMVLNHAVLLFALDEPVLFAGYTAFSVYALLVVAIPFRRRETWAWYASWVLPIGLAAPAALSNDPSIAPFYYAVAAVCMLALLLTMRDFLSVSRPVVRKVS
jgi:hypothetical protein